MRLTGTGAGVLATSAALAYMTVVFASPPLGVVAAAGLFALAAAVLVVAGARHGHVPISVSASAVERGDAFTVTYGLPARRALRLLLRTELDLGLGSLVETGLPEHVDGAWVLPLRAIRHGTLTLGPAVLVHTDPFGLCRRRVIAGAARNLLILPARVPVTGAPQHGRPRPDGLGRGLRSESGDFDTLRPYEIGDDVRLIHWPNSARTGDILVRRHVEPPAHELLILQDTCGSSFASAEDFEQAVDFSASVTAAVVRRGVTTRLCTTTSEQVVSWAGEARSSSAVGRAFSAVQPDTERWSTGPSPVHGDPIVLRHVPFARSSSCTIVTGVPSLALLEALDHARLPRRTTLVCLSPRRPPAAIWRWAGRRGAILLDAANARIAAAQWSTLTLAPR